MVEKQTVLQQRNFDEHECAIDQQASGTHWNRLLRRGAGGLPRLQSLGPPRRRQTRHGIDGGWSWSAEGRQAL